MEFNEKLQKLRKDRGLTQEELAQELFVSRTAISKWESGRGYPNIDSLKELSAFFSVSIDELICSEDIISLAEKDKKVSIQKYVSLICETMDIFVVILLFIPIFGIKAEAVYELSGVYLWEKAVFIGFISLIVLNGLCGIILLNFDKPTWSKYSIAVGMILSIIGCIVFISARQPYASLVCFLLLIIKGFLLFKSK